MGFFEKLGLGLKKSSTKISDGLSEIFTKKKLDEQTLENLEEALISADIGVKATTEIMQKFSSQKQNKEIEKDEVLRLLAGEMEEILRAGEKDFVLEKKPCVILMVGVNGAGKTTTIGKLAAKFKAMGKQVSLIAGDTFRAAAVEQLSEWGEKCGVRVFKGATGADSAGLCYDGLSAALKEGDDIVFIDTAGRLQNKSGLMDELKKIVRVIQKIMPDAPHKILLTLDATTGQNALDQVKTFREIIGVNGLIVTKLDGSSKGGILVAIVKETGLPIYFIGVGEKQEDLDVFKAHDYALNLLGLK